MPQIMTQVKYFDNWGYSREHSKDLTKRQGELIVVLGQDPKLNNPDPVHRWDRDDGPESKEWIVLYHRPPDLAKPRPVGLARRPDFIFPYDNGDDPGEDDEDWNRKKNKQKENPSLSFHRQGPREKEGGPEEEGFRYGTPAARVLRELGVASWEIYVNEDRDPCAEGEECQSQPNVMLPPKHCVEAMRAPERSNGIACKVDVDWRAHNGDEDDGVKPSQVPSDERNTAGDQQRVRNKCLGPEGGCYTLR